MTEGADKRVYRNSALTCLWLALDHLYRAELLFRRAGEPASAAQALRHANEIKEQWRSVLGEATSKLPEPHP